MAISLDDVARVLEEQDGLLDKSQYRRVTTMDVQEAARGGRSYLIFIGGRPFFGKRNVTDPVDSSLEGLTADVRFNVYGDGRVSDLHVLGTRMFAPAEIYEEGMPYGDAAREIARATGTRFTVPLSGEEISGEYGAFESDKDLSSAQELKDALTRISAAQEMLSEYLPGSRLDPAL